MPTQLLRLSLLLVLCVASTCAAAPEASVPEALRPAVLRNETTQQFTTFKFETKQKTTHVGRGQRVTIADVKGRGYISQLWMTTGGWFYQSWNPPAPYKKTFLKTLILRIYWDGATKPAVEAPVADFFGAGLCEMGNFASRRFGTSSGGFFSKFVMPFRTGFRIELENLDPDIDTDIFCNALYQLTDSLSAEAAYFHAQFNTGRLQGPEPMPIAAAHGNGQFVGCAVYMQGEERRYLNYMEAPEYVYVDQDWDKPRIVGTGLEDYFLGGWYFREGPFIGPLHGVITKDPFNATMAMYRIHEGDEIRFRERFRFDFVNSWSPDKQKPFAWSSVGFLYLDRPEGQGPVLPAAKDLVPWYRIRDTDHFP